MPGTGPVAVAAVVLGNGDRYGVGLGAPDNPITAMILCNGVIEIYMLKGGNQAPSVYVWPDAGTHVFTETGIANVLGPKAGGS